MKKLFSISEEHYANPFLRDIRLRYLMYGSLSEKQVSAFKDVAEKIRKGREAGKAPERAPAQGARKINKSKPPLIE